MNKTTRLIANQGFEVISTPNELDKLAILLSEIVFDIAIVNSGSEEAQEAFHLLNRKGVPVVFMVGTKADWQTLKLMDAYAYIPEVAGEPELIARWNAAYRRLLRINSWNRTADRGDIYEHQGEGIGN